MIKILLMTTIIFFSIPAKASETILPITATILSVQETRNKCCFDQPSWCFNKMIYNLYKTPLNEVIDSRQESIPLDAVACYDENMV